MKTSTILLLLVVFTSSTFAQNYIKRSAEEPVYDVEVIVFGQLLSQPPADTIQQAAIFNQDAAVTVDFLPEGEDWLVIKEPTTESADESSQDHSDNQSQMPQNQDASAWQVPLEEQPIDYEVLVWYLQNDDLTGPVVNLLEKNPKYKPLLRQVWRQPATPFNDPLYVKVNSHTEDLDSEPDSLLPEIPEVPAINEYGFNEEPIIELNDFQIDGQVALSQGRFTHLHIKINYYRINQENEALIYASKQQRQIKPDQWQYFDHQQFGVLIKVTAVKAKELL